MAHEERCGLVAQYEYKLYRCAQYGLAVWLTKSDAVWLSTSFADVRMCGWLTKSSAEWLTKSSAELAQSRTTSDFGKATTSA